MGWFDVAAAPGGKAYSVTAFPTGTIRLGGVPGAVPGGVATGGLEIAFHIGLFTRLVNRFVFRGSWTVRVAPWYGKRGKRWKERRPNEMAADQRAEALFSLIHSGAWDPEQGAPPLG